MKRFLCIAVFFSLLMLTMKLLPKVRAEEASPDPSLCLVLAEASTGTVLSAQNENKQVPSGSLPKLMTVLLSAEHGFSESDRLTAGDEVSGTKGAVVWLTAGEEISISDLYKSVIIGNANDAAKVLACSVSGSEEAFIRDMNRRAFELGMKDTAYKSCCEDMSGHTTAHDTALLAHELLKHRELKKYFTVWRDTVRNGQTEVVSENQLLNTYEGVDGLKAGRIGESFYCVSTAHRSSGGFIAVVLGCTDKNERFDVGKMLLKKGFSSYKVTAPGFSGEFIRPVEVRGGTVGSVMLAAKDLRELAVPKGCKSIDTAVLIPSYVQAPVKKGQRIGTIGFYNGRTLLLETELVAQNAVPKKSFKDGLRKCLDILYK